MVSFLLYRFAWFLLILLGVSFITFFLMHAVPGGPWDAEKALPPSVIENLNRRYGLSDPYLVQYAKFLGNALQGDLGVSFVQQNAPVTEILLKGLPPTLVLAGTSFALSAVVGLTLGIGSALRKGTPLDYLAAMVATGGACIPNFVLGACLVLVLSLGLRWLPTSGWGGAQHVLLPALTLATLPTAFIARISRAAALDALSEEYVRTARSKGLPDRVVVLRHVLRNALIPVLTVFGPIAAQLATGSFVVETMYSVPGVGRLLVQSVVSRDYGLIMGAALLFAAAIAMANLVVDVLYAVIDPRVRTPR